MNRFLFLVRNAGNLIPHSQHFLDEFTTTEPAALELGCIVNDIRHIIVCGHSDCKAMNLLYQLQDEEMASQVTFSHKFYWNVFITCIMDVFKFGNHICFYFRSRNS